MKIEIPDGILTKDLAAIAKQQGMEVGDLAGTLIALAMIHIRQLAEAQELSEEIEAGEKMLEGARGEYRQARKDYVDLKASSKAFRSAGRPGVN